MLFKFGSETNAQLAAFDLQRLGIRVAAEYDEIDVDDGEISPDVLDLVHALGGVVA